MLGRWGLVGNGGMRSGKAGLVEPCRDGIDKDW